jgi:hypothetical protein
MDLGDWLRGLGLGQYEAAFRENEVDDAVLPSLKGEDLKELGVHLVGHRRRLLGAIAALRTGGSAKPAAPTFSRQSSSLLPTRPSAAKSQ